MIPDRDRIAERLAAVGYVADCGAWCAQVPYWRRWGCRRIRARCQERRRAHGEGAPVGDGRGRLLHRRAGRGGLVGLGWSAKEADRAVSEVEPDAAQMPQPDVATLLRAALRTLSKA